MDTSPARGSRAVVIGLAAATFGLLGGCMTLAGALLPVLLDELGIGLMDAGSMLALQPIGFLVAVTMARAAIERGGLAAVITLGVLMAAAGFAAFGSISTWAGGAATMLLAGIGVGFTEVATNAAVITVVGANSNRVLNFVHVFFGVGSFVTPFLATRAIAAGSSWRLAFFIVAGLTALLALGWWFVRLERVRMASDSATGARRTSRAIVLLAIVLALYVGTEMGVGGWLTKYLVATHAASLSDAGMVLSAYWFAVALGRLVLSAVPLQATGLSEESLLVALSALATVALLVALSVPNLLFSAIAFAVVGLGFSGIFPGVVALGGRYQPHAVSAATTTIITGAGLGNIIIPWVMSATADYSDVSTGMYVYAAMSAAMLGLAMLVRRNTRIFVP